jgi:hypothetical protein
MSKEPMNKEKPVCEDCQSEKPTPHAHSNIPPMNNEEWEAEFDENFVEWTAYKPKSPAAEKIKSFIRTKLEEAYQRGLKEGEENTNKVYLSREEAYQAGMEAMKKAAIEVTENWHIELDDPKNTIARIRAEDTTAEYEVSGYNSAIEKILASLQSLPITNDTKK